MTLLTSKLAILAGVRFPDLPAILLGVALAPILLLAPGYFWSRVLDVGSGSRAHRAAWSLLLSLATTPILAYLFFLVVPYRSGTVWLFALLQAALPAALHHVLRPAAAPRPVCFEPPRRIPRRLWILPPLMALLAVSCVMDVDWGQHLYRGSPSADYAKHIIVTDAIHRTGVHPENPALHPGRPLPLFYYFFWFLLCSMLDGLAFWNLGPRAAVQAMTAWGAFSLFALVFLLASHLVRPVTRRTIGICFVLVFASGLDLLGALVFAFVDVRPGEFFWRHEMEIHAGVDGWNWVGKVASWLATVTWVPQHLAAVVVSMTGLLLVFGLPRSPSRASQWARSWIFATAAASSLGLSIWVTLVFCVFWPLWAAVAARRRWWDDLRLLARAALPAALLSAPFVFALLRAQVDRRPPLEFDVRDQALWQTYSVNFNLGGWRDVIDLVLLVPTYFLEFGIFFLGCLFWWKHRRRPLARNDLALAWLAMVSTVLVSVLRSSLQHNDFGWRAFLPAQLVFLLWTGWMLERLRRLRRRPALVAGCLVLGFLTVAFDWAVLTSYPTLHDLSEHRGAEGRRNRAMKGLYEEIRRATPTGAIVQQNPFVVFAYDHAFNANRQSAVLDTVHGTLFDTQGPVFVLARHDVATIFESGASAQEIESAAGKYNIAVLVVQDTDPGWNSAAWEDRRRFRPLAECQFARAYELIRNSDP